MGIPIPSRSEESLNHIHVFMVSFPAQGHVNPLLRLGKLLANFGLLVTLCAPESAGRAIRKAKKSTDGEATGQDRGTIRFEFFEDGSDFKDPKVDDIGCYLAKLETAGREKLPQMIREQEEMGRPVCCLINNPFIPWVSDVAEELGIPSAMLWIQSCASFSACYHYFHNLVPFPSEEEPEIDVHLPCMPLLKHDEIPSLLHPSRNSPVLARTILGQFKSLSKPFCILMETFQALENENIEYMSQVLHRPIRTIGPLLRDDNGVANEKSNGIRADFFETEDCMEWLDGKPPRSVVYISFGSVVNLKLEQIEEIAYGILSAGVSFVWVLRQPEFLPEEFLDRVGEQGKIVQWSLQDEVLAHPSTACFVTHCGWNSTMEAVASGVPVVTFPQWGDQVTNAKFLVDVFKVGVRMGRGEAEGRIVRREEVERSLRAATAGTEAAERRENARKWKNAATASVAPGGTSHTNMEDFVQEIVNIKRNCPST